MNIVKRWKVAAAAVAFSGMPSLAIAADANLQPSKLPDFSEKTRKKALFLKKTAFFPFRGILTRYLSIV